MPLINLSPNIMKNYAVVACLAMLFLLGACDSSSNNDAAADSAGDSMQTAGSTTASNTAGSTTDGTTASTAGTTTGNGSDTAGGTGVGTDTGGTGPDNNVSLLDAGLSHAGTPINSVAEIANDPQVLASGRDRAATLADSPAIIFEVVRNQGTSAGLDCSALGAQYNSCSIVNLHIKDSDGSLSDSAWKLFFHSTRRILQATSNEFNVAHVNGDLHYVSPNDQFAGFAGGVKSIKLVTEYNHLVETDFQPRYWIARGGNTILIANTDNDTDESAYAMDIVGDNRFEYVGETNQIATSTIRYDRNSAITSAASTIAAERIASRIVPQPTSVVQGAGTLDISAGFSFAGIDLPAASIAALQSRQAQFMNTNAGVSLAASIDATVPANSYRLNVTATGITIAASDQSMLCLNTVNRHYRQPTISISRHAR